ncbi:OmpA family protein [Idiomarina xiamenensis]|uniref:OprF n=1 Tax=Idiomarina xiamenensis 10-D-4 TaxID=740709 RepID=K2JJY0_9GAMM|nr:OmpA family protein [Idiomarina xiamenensis]EKE83731.1 OprF [Idiomarina xiamenensis 10-D-4]
MKRLSLLTLAIIGASAMQPALAHDKQGDYGDFYFGARLGAFDTDSDRFAVKDGAAFDYSSGINTFTGGLELGHRLTEAWEARLYYDYLQGSLRGTSSDAYGDAFGVDVLYNFKNNVYAGLGINRTRLEGFDDTFLRGTVGYRQFFNNNWAWRVEGGVQQNDGNLTEYFTNVGVQYFFGNTYNDSYQEERPQTRPQPEPAPAAAPVDSDGDGVPDSRDKCPNTPASYSVDKDGCIIYRNETVKRELVIEFPFDSYEIRDGYDDDIRKTADFMKEHPQLDIMINGHTDQTGPAEYNQWLSEQRAKAVGERMINNYGIAKQRVQWKGYGENRPKNSGETKAQRQENRRIEAELKVTERVPVKKN